MTPGSNLLLEALDLIESQPVIYFRFISRALNDAGFYVTTYAPGEPVFVGSVQAVPRTRYEVLGLEMEKEYVTWFVPQDVTGLERDSAGDAIEWNGGRYDLATPTKWTGQDGWMSIICVKQGAANA